MISSSPVRSASSHPSSSSRCPQQSNLTLCPSFFLSFFLLVLFSGLGNSDYLDEHTFYKFGTYHVEPGMMTAEDEAKMEAKAAAAAAKAEAQKKQN